MADSGLFGVFLPTRVHLSVALQVPLRPASTRSQFFLCPLPPDLSRYDRMVRGRSETHSWPSLGALGLSAQPWHFWSHVTLHKESFEQGPKTQKRWHYPSEILFLVGAAFVFCSAPDFWLFMNSRYSPVWNCRIHPRIRFWAPDVVMSAQKYIRQFHTGEYEHEDTAQVLHSESRPTSSAICHKCSFGSALRIECISMQHFR